VIPQIAKIADPANYLFELGFRHCTDLLAGCATGVANSKDSCELFQREPDFESATHEPNPLNSFGRILPVPGRGSLRALQDPDFLIMAERICTDTAFASEFAGLHVAPDSLPLASIDPGTGSGVKDYFPAFEGTNDPRTRESVKRI
jgi:hypothetical protein